MCIYIYTYTHTHTHMSIYDESIPTTSPRPLARWVFPPALCFSAGSLPGLTTSTGKIWRPENTQYHGNNMGIYLDCMCIYIILYMILYIYINSQNYDAGSSRNGDVPIYGRFNWGSHGPGNSSPLKSSWLTTGTDFSSEHVFWDDLQLP
jgi:hypothetical protein